jgi:hypothetical protein
MIRGRWVRVRIGGAAVGALAKAEVRGEVRAKVTELRVMWVVVERGRGTVEGMS